MTDDVTLQALKELQADILLLRVPKKEKKKEGEAASGNDPNGSQSEG